MAEVKNALKEAKRAMKENDFEAVSKHCKTALKHDRKNYNALVLFGRACQEINKLQDSKKGLMLATQVDPENPIAWQGLAALCEKQPDITTRYEAITIYTRLKDIIKDDDTKLNNTFRKLATLQLKDENALGAAVTLRELVTRLQDQKLALEAWRSIAQILTNYENLPDEESRRLQEALENILNDSVLGENEGNYQSYLRLLYRTKQLPKLVNVAQTMANIFTTAYPLEWISRVYVIMKAEAKDGEDFPLEEEEALQYVVKLLSLNKASPWGNLARGLMYQQEGMMDEAKAHLRVGAERTSNNLLSWSLLLSVQESTNDWPGVEVTCKKSIAILESNFSMFSNVSIPGDEEAEAYQWKMKLTRAKAYVHMGHENHLREAVAILQEQANTNLDSGLMLIKSRIKLKELETAAEEIEKLREVHGEDPQFKLLRASLLRAHDKKDEALQLLEEFVQEQPSVAEGHLELGRLYFETGILKKAQLCLMRAGKLDPKLGHAFLYLGHFFRYQDNMEKALKCYEKALNLNPCDDETGAALSDMYRILEQHEANIRLLHRVTTEAGRSSCGWAWLRLGLHYYTLEDYNEAIQAFQYTLTINPKDSSAYECLGDAYLARGAHTAALKVFTYAAQCNPDALYPLYQIAHIKQMIGENLEALKDYRAVLEREPMPAVQVVAYIGMAEALIASAMKYYEQFFLSNLKDVCLQAITALMKAGSQKPESACIWKLLGDACILLFPVPDSIAKFTIPSKLIHRDIEDMEAVEEVDKLQILQLGARCYGAALQTMSDNANLWHDLGVNTYFQGIVIESQQKTADNETIKDLMTRSLGSLKKSLSLEPTNGKILNSLGIVATHKVLGEYKLAQHALIASCQYESTSVNWTHLGAFYLTHGDPHLAHEAFSQAQACDPSFVTCWVGQALIAESVGHSEAYDLFRHTTLLGIQVESCMGFAHHVTRLACDVDSQNNSRIQLAVKQALPTATDCLVFYTREKETDVVGLNMAGLALEMMGLYQTAIQAYQMAVAAVDPEQPDGVKMLDGIRCNLGRALTADGRVDEGILQYNSIKEPDFFTQCGLALACLKANKFEEAISGYTAALHWLAPNDSQKSHILVALASLQYKFQNPNESKSLLFQGSQLTGASVRGLLALAALGLISGDPVLISAALAELVPYQNNPDYLHHIAFLRAAEATAKGNSKEARLIFSRAIHQHPSNAPLWRSLARHLLTTTNQTKKECIAAATCASSATRLAQAAGHNKTVAQDAVTSVMATLGSEKASQSNCKSSLQKAQRAVIMCPGSSEAWAMLIAAKVAAGKAQKQDHISKLAQTWSAQASPRIAFWLQKISTQTIQVA